MGKRQRRRLREIDKRKMPNESKKAFLKRSGGKHYDITGVRDKPYTFRPYAEDVL